MTSWEGPGHALRSVNIAISYNGSIARGQVSEVGVESVPNHRTSFSYLCQRQFKEGFVLLVALHLQARGGRRREGDPPTLT